MFGLLVLPFLALIVYQLFLHHYIIF